MPSTTDINSVNGDELLRISNLRVYFETDAGEARAVDGVSFEMFPRETLGLVGESGCGKSVTVFSILKLLQSPPARYAGGEIQFRGKNLLAMSERELRSVRGKLISMIFQEPASSLNPTLTIGRQITEAILEHEKVSNKEARDRAIKMLGRAGVASAEQRFNAYPHQLSGGLKQRAMIAMALVCRPVLLIADEPTTALDVTIQAQILDLLRELQDDYQMSVLLITHDMGVVAETCDRVAVMYAGKIVEYSPVRTVFEKPRHPYTVGLFRSLPSLGQKREKLPTIPGVVPDPLHYPSGCRFRTRCEMAEAICEQEPPLREIEPGHFSACHFAEKVSFNQ